MFTNNPFGGLNSDDYENLAKLDFSKYKSGFKTQFPKDEKDFGFYGRQPATKGAALFLDARGIVHALPSGFFLVTGGTGVGKSITCAALAAASAALVEPDYTDEKGGIVKVGASKSAYMYVFEARGPDVKIAPAGLMTALEHLAPIVVAGKAFDEKSLSGEERELATVTGTMPFFTSLRDGTNKFGRRLLVIDSLSLAMRQYSSKTISDMGRSGEPTMPGGLQPSDVDFCVKMNALAAACGFTVLGLVNNDLVPFASKLEGIVEGEINILGPGYFSFRQRSTRVRTVVNLPVEALNKGRDYMRYAARSGGSLLSMPNAPDLGQMGV